MISGGGTTPAPEISPALARELLDRMQGRRVLVVGDLMLDRYVWGAVSRISPEAPVPVVEVESESARLGGAANVVNNLIGLGAEAIPFGVVGDDAYGEQVLALLREQGIPVHGVIVEKGRTTTVKTRVIAHAQHVVRVDRESRRPLSDEAQDSLLRALEKCLEEADAVIFEDYNKGVLSPTVVREALQRARTTGTITGVDPKFENFFEYRRATLFKPNRKEAEAVLGRMIRSWDDVLSAGAELRQRLLCDHLMITLGEDGLALFESDGAPVHVPTRARRVADVSGAGDTVIATATLALAVGATPIEAAVLANYAAGVVCGEVGVVPIDREGLLRAVEQGA